MIGLKLYEDINYGLIFWSKETLKEYLKLLHNLCVSSFKAKQFTLADAFESAIEEIENRYDERAWEIKAEQERLAEMVESKTEKVEKQARARKKK